MRKRIIKYRQNIDELINNADNDISWSEIIANHLIQISFFQHERLVHLIVTVTFAILTVISLGIAVVTDSLSFALLTIGLIVLLIPYIFHYYILENEVQKMYEQYDIMLETKNISMK